LRMSSVLTTFIKDDDDDDDDNDFQHYPFVFLISWLV